MLVTLVYPRVQFDFGAIKLLKGELESLGIKVMVSVWPTVNPDSENFAELERRNPGRICVAILDLGNGRRIEHRANERILMCSTFKAIAAGYVLSRVDKKEETLERRVVFSQRDVVQGAPATQSRVGEPGMTMAELCEAAVTLSDNTAGNLLLASFGGPAALTGFFRSLGDDVSHLDRVEDVLGRKIINYHSQILFDPDLLVEIFVLDPTAEPPTQEATG